MKQLFISLKNELKYIIELFYLLDPIIFYYESIIVLVDTKYLLFSLFIFHNYPNISIISDSKYAPKNTFFHYFENKKDFLKNLNKSFPMIHNISHLYLKIPQDHYTENLYYQKLMKSICTDEYVFYYNKTKKKLINYFGDLYIYDPLENYYDDTHNYYKKWMKMNENNLLFYIKIILKAKEIHIYDEDLLYLLLEFDISSIENKYYYNQNFLIKEDEPRLKSWKIILLD